jgi:hypothetical protein
VANDKTERRLPLMTLTEDNWIFSIPHSKELIATSPPRSAHLQSCGVWVFTGFELCSLAFSLAVVRGTAAEGENGDRKCS